MQKKFILEWVINEFGTIILIIVSSALALNGFFSYAPVNFWAGDEVKAADIADIKAYTVPMA